MARGERESRVNCRQRPGLGTQIPRGWRRVTSTWSPTEETLSIRTAKWSIFGGTRIERPKSGDYHYGYGCNGHSWWRFDPERVCNGRENARELRAMRA